jgi:crotonobetaine/carnitine-CoA ligase
VDISGVALENRTVRAVMEAGLRARPDQTALRDPDCALTYQETWTEALRFARGFSALGMKRQEPALLMLDNHVENVVCWLGLCLSGRLEIAINTAYLGTMLSHMIADSQARVIVIEEKYLPRLIEIAAAVPDLAIVVVRRGGTEEAAPEAIESARTRWDLHWFEELRAHEPAEPDNVDPWDMISISYTSGTTGRSKGVLCPHAHAFCQATPDGLGSTQPGEVRFVVLPQFHVAGRWGGIYNALIHGGTAYIAPSFSASRFWSEAATVNAKTSQLVGTMAEFLARQPPGASDREHQLREIAILPLPFDLSAWKARFGVNVTTAYGSTELGAIVTTTDTSSNSVGRARQGYDIRIFDENDRELPRGEVGELVVRPLLSWTTSAGYLRQPEQSLATWRNGWLHSGDALYQDEEGNFFFVDRLDDAIRRRGENVSSAEVEMHINAHPAVAECAAIAVPSDFAEDEIKAVVVLHEGAQLKESDLIAFLRDTMPRFMVPRYLLFVEALPKTATSKVKKAELRKADLTEAWDAHAREG